MRLTLVILALSLLAATGCQNTELNQCRDENAALQTKLNKLQQSTSAQVEAIGSMSEMLENMSRERRNHMETRKQLDTAQNEIQSLKTRIAELEQQK